jgi:hypothetical protein
MLEMLNAMRYLGNECRALFNGISAALNNAAVALGRAVHVEPMKPILKAPGTKSLKLYHDEPPPIVAFKFKLRHYNSEAATLTQTSPPTPTPALTPPITPTSTMTPTPTKAPRAGAQTRSHFSST